MVGEIINSFQHTEGDEGEKWNKYSIERESVPEDGYILIKKSNIYLDLFFFLRRFHLFGLREPPCVLCMISMAMRWCAMCAAGKRQHTAQTRRGISLRTLSWCAFFFCRFSYATVLCGRNRIIIMSAHTSRCTSANRMRAGRDERCKCMELIKNYFYISARASETVARRFRMEILLAMCLTSPIFQLNAWQKKTLNRAAHKYKHAWHESCDVKNTLNEFCTKKK